MARFAQNLPAVSFESNLEEVLSGLAESRKEAALAAAKVVARKAREDLKDGFKGTADEPLEHAQNITAEWDEDAEEARVGLPESGAPDEASYYVFWEFGHFNVFTDQYERERWLSRSQEGTQGEQTAAAVEAAEGVFQSFPGVRDIGAAGTGFTLFVVSDLIT